MNKYIIAIDGGGTKTLGVLYDIKGQEMTRVECGYANFSVDIPQSQKHIENAIETLIRALGKNDALSIIQLGIAGISALPDPERYSDTLRKQYQTRVEMTSDAVIALYSVKRNANQSVIMVIGGTGSIVMANEHTDVYIVGGFGHLLGEEGSGYHVAIAALKQLLNEQEQGVLSPLSEKILAAINGKKRENVLDFVYNQDKSKIASLAKMIAQFASEKDVDAIKLLKREGHYLAEQTAQAYQKLKTKETIVVALRGKFLLQAPYVKASLIEKLRELIGPFTLDESDSEPVSGAYYLAKINLEKEVTL